MSEKQLEELIKEAISTVLARNQLVEIQNNSTFKSSCNSQRLKLAEAKILCASAKARAVLDNVAVSIAIVDSGGNLVLFERMDGAVLVSVQCAQDKAFTAVSFEIETEELGKRINDFPGIESSQGGRIVSFVGGAPLYRDGMLVGGIGISGGTLAEDKNILQEALSVNIGEPHGN